MLRAPKDGPSSPGTGYTGKRNASCGGRRLHQLLHKRFSEVRENTTGSHADATGVIEAPDFWRVPTDQMAEQLQGGSGKHTGIGARSREY